MNSKRRIFFLLIIALFSVYLCQAQPLVSDSAQIENTVLQIYYKTLDESHIVAYNLNSDKKPLISPSERKQAIDSLNTHYYNLLSIIDNSYGQQVFTSILNKMGEVAMSDTTNVRGLSIYASILLKYHRHTEANQIYKMCYNQLEDEPIAAAPSQIGMGMCELFLRHYPAAMEYLEPAVALLDEMADDDISFFVQERAEAHRGLGSCYAAFRDTVHSIQHYKKSIELLQHLYKKDSSLVNLRQLADVEGLFGQSYIFFKNEKEALQCCMRATAILDTLYSLNPNRHRAAYAFHLSLYALSLQKAGRYDDARNKYELAVDLYRQAVAINPEPYQTFLISCLINYAYVYGRVKEPERALSLLKEAEAIVIRAAQQYPIERFKEATIYSNLATIYQKIGNFEQAEVYAKRARPMLEEFISNKSKAVQECLTELSKTEALIETHKKVQTAIE